MFVGLQENLYCYLRLTATCVGFTYFLRISGAKAKALVEDLEALEEAPAVQAG